MGKTERKRCATKRKETEERLLMRDYKEALLTKLKSKIKLFEIKPFAEKRSLRSPCLFGVVTP